MENDLQNVLREDDRSFVVAALQALWRERVAAFMVAEGIAKSRGLCPLDSAEFGIEDTRNMLLRFGAQPPFF
ncbi:MAG: hypothetical protein K2X55_17320 [Burkholderiaceae bacterium]|nr:hypothetical protein [Burkholderiaceae bacterium]